jgi:hypothetical protein
VHRAFLAVLLWLWVAGVTIAYMIQFRELLAAVLKLYR